MSAYGKIASPAEDVHLPYFPIKGRLKNGLEIHLIEYDSKFESQLYPMVKKVIEDGQTYPFETMNTVEEFRAYYLSHKCYLCIEENDNEPEVIGSFYIKPNFPGRCAHICNTGFIVKEQFSGQGVGTFMVPHFLQIARDLGYESSFFNLVFVTNPASIRLWEKFGFQVAGRLPRAGKLKGLGYVDALQYYYDLRTVEKSPGVVVKSTDQ